MVKWRRIPPVVREAASGALYDQDGHSLRWILPRDPASMTGHSLFCSVKAIEEQARRALRSCCLRDAVFVAERIAEALRIAYWQFALTCHRTRNRSRFVSPPRTASEDLVFNWASTVRWTNLYTLQADGTRRPPRKIARRSIFWLLRGWSNLMSPPSTGAGHGDVARVWPNVIAPVED